MFIGGIFLCFHYLFECKKNQKPPEEAYIEGLGDIAVKGMQGYLDKLELPTDAIQRGQLAIAQWENQINDPVPILVFAKIKKMSDTIAQIVLYFSDEDKDVVGFKIKEIRNFEDGEKQIIEETYPVFGHFSPPSVWVCVFHAEKREGNKRKDEELWKSYATDEKVWLTYIENNDILKTSSNVYFCSRP